MSVIPSSTFYKHVHVDIPYPYMKYVVGKKGTYFKKCKENSGVDSIWYNVKRNIVEIYGPQNKLDSASNMLSKQMERVRKKIPNNELEQFQSTYVKSTDTSIAGSLEGALTKDQVKYLIGKKGKHFKQFTKETNVSFIWYDEENHNVVIWGPQENLEHAIQKLFQQIEKIKSYNNNTINNDIVNDIEMCD